MTDTKQPEALRKFQAIDFINTEEELEAYVSGRMMGLQQGYDAARLEIEALRARQPPVAAQEPIEVHEPKCPALIGDACTCDRHDPAVDKAWARFCAKIGDGPNAPYPGMISAFERYYAQSFTDKDWRREASVWAAAWKQAMLAAAPAAQAAPAVVAGPVAYRVLRKRHDGEWITDGRAWCDGVPTQELVDDIALRSDGWRIEYAFAAPAIGAPVAQGDALPREDFAWLVVQEACETEPADEDDPECIRILRRDLKSAVLAAFLRHDAARAQAKEGGAA